MATKSIFHPNYDKFRQQLTAARKSAALSQDDLAGRLGRPQSFVSKYERGERRLDIHEFFEIAAVLKIDSLRFLKRIYGTKTARKGKK